MKMIVKIFIAFLLIAKKTLEIRATSVINVFIFTGPYTSTRISVSITVNREFEIEEYFFIFSVTAKLLEIF